MNGIPISTAVMFIAFNALQLVMISMLPLSRGYTSLWPTLTAIVSINIAILLFARIIFSGAPLSVVVPLSGTVIPLGAILIGVVVNKEPASFVRIALLVGASGIIGVASSLS